MRASRGKNRLLREEVSGVRVVELAVRFSLPCWLSVTTLRLVVASSGVQAELNMCDSVVVVVVAAAAAVVVVVVPTIVVAIIIIIIVILRHLI